MNRDAAQRLEAWLSRALGEPVRIEAAKNPGEGAAQESRALGSPVRIESAKNPGDGAARESRALGTPVRIESVKNPGDGATRESRALGSPVRIESAKNPGDGAARESRAIVVTAGGGEQPRRYLRVVGGEAPPERESGRTRREEFALLRAVHDAGVHVPRPLVLCEDAGVLGAPFFVTDFISAHGRWMQRPELAAQLGREFAKLHRITPPHPRLRFLDRAPSDVPAARVDGFRRRLDAMGEPQPVLEWAMRQLERSAPEGAVTVLCHGAPRAGGCLVGDGGALAILDWEGYRWGDPYEDLGAFCAECRRHVSGHPEDGGGASRTGFLDGYREISGLDIDEDLLRYWVVMATLGRAVAALEHGHRFVAGGERSVELALTGRRVAEMEIDLLVETDRLAMESAHA